MRTLVSLEEDEVRSANKVYAKDERSGVVPLLNDEHRDEDEELDIWFMVGCCFRWEYLFFV